MNPAHFEAQMLRTFENAKSYGFINQIDIDGGEYRVLWACSWHGDQTAEWVYEIIIEHLIVRGVGCEHRAYVEVDRLRRMSPGREWKEIKSWIIYTILTHYSNV